MRSDWLKVLVLALLLALPLGALAQGSDPEDEPATDVPADDDDSAAEGDDDDSAALDDDDSAEGDDDDSADDDAVPAPEPDPEAAQTVAEAAPDVADPGQLVARVQCAGRVAGGVLVAGGTAVIAPLEAVQLGYPVDVRLGDGHLTTGRITAVDRVEELALVTLDEPAPDAPTTPLSRELPALGEPVTIIGHGGATGLSDLYQVERELLTFSVVHARVASSPVEFDDLAPAEQPRRFLVDRPVGEGDAGSPVFDQRGRVVGLLMNEVEDGGGRSIAVGAASLDDLVAEPALAKPWRKRHHLQSWGGIGLAAHNRPSHLAGAILYGIRVALLDSIRFEPWLEVDLGTRAARAAEEDRPARPRDFWWSIETGLTVGYRIPMFVEGGRNYIIPTAGFRIGWNRFQHKVDQLVSSCSGDDGADCGFVLERHIDQERSLRPGIDLGIDVRHGKVRFGYRFFIDPMAVRAHSMHRLIVTFDGLLLPIRVGDSN